MLDRVRETLIANNYRLHTTLHQFAAAGDVVAVQSLLECKRSDCNGKNRSSDNSNNGTGDDDDDDDDDDVDIINATSKGKNTALHSALSHNQQGLVLDCLLQRGADVHAFNTKGYNPLVLAIIHCQPGTQALQKLVEAGADWKSKYRRGKFSGLDLVDIARQYKNHEAVDFLQQLNGHRKMENDTKGGAKARCMGDEPLSSNHNVCPLCQCVVKFPTKMSFIEWDQQQAEQKANERALEVCTVIKDKKEDENVHQVTSSTRIEKGKGKKEIYTSRRYLDQFLSHSNGRAYETLCRIEYHGINNKSRLRKEISESYSCLHAAQQCCVDLGLDPAPSSPVMGNEFRNMENVFLIDLCSGKSLTTALCSVLFQATQIDNDGSDGSDSMPSPSFKNGNNHFLAIDKLPAHQVPHFTTNSANASYLSRDIMSDSFFHELEREVRRQSVQEGRMVLLVGMHLCGNLSERAIEIFQRIKLIRAIVLSPCCLPKLRQKKKKRNNSNKKHPNGEQKLGEEDAKEDLTAGVRNGNKTSANEKSVGPRHHFLERLQNGDDSYTAWVDHLRDMTTGINSSDEAEDGKNDDDKQFELLIRSYRDDDIHSIKNAIISAVRLPIP